MDILLFCHVAFIEKKSYLIVEALDDKSPRSVRYFSVSTLPILAVGLLQKTAENEAVLYVVCADAIVIGELVLSAFDLSLKFTIVQTVQVEEVSLVETISSCACKGLDIKDGKDNQSRTDLILASSN